MAHHSSIPLNDFFAERMRELIPERPRFGATGQFPQGQYHPSDEGEIAFGVAADKEKGKVIINFGKPVAWFGMDREQALELAESLKQKADDLLDISKLSDAG